MDCSSLIIGCSVGGANDCDAATTRFGVAIDRDPEAEADFLLLFSYTHSMFIDLHLRHLGCSEVHRVLCAWHSLQAFGARARGVPASVRWIEGGTRTTLAAKGVSHLLYFRVRNILCQEGSSSLPGPSSPLAKLQSKLNLTQALHAPPVSGFPGHLT